MVSERDRVAFEERCRHEREPVVPRVMRGDEPCRVWLDIAGSGIAFTGTLAECREWVAAEGVASLARIVTVRGGRRLPLGRR